ncbi:MAG TPA: universal stress protein [Candidatus Binataceae bacterium]|nr:universal stress protein [Candidatus Binataceae bacterium]
MATEIKRILCPIDYFSHSMAALEYAVDLAKQHGAKLILLNVAPLPLGESVVSPVPLEPFPFQDAEHRKQLEKIAHERVEGKVFFEIMVVAGDPGPAIMRAIRSSTPDLVVLGTHGRRGIGHLVLGSVAEFIVRESPVPVLTVRATALGEK